jgi:MYXO-CTERM domain-containing protein
MQRLTLLAALLAGCDGGLAAGIIGPLDPAPIDPEEPPTGFSAPQIFVIANLAGSVVQVDGMDPVCPMVTRSSGQTILEGGCTDEDGDMWFGRAVLPPSEGGTTGPTNGTSTYDGFGSDSLAGCEDQPEARRRQTFDGTVVVTGDLTSIEYDVDLVVTIEGLDSDCTSDDGTLGIDYQGSAAIGDDTSEWNGSGSIGSTAFGRYDIETEGEVLDEAICEDEAISGTTTITGADVAVITYDGATDCDMESTVTWTLNGEDQGEITGVSCSASQGSNRGSWIALALAAIGLALRRRRP